MDRHSTWASVVSRSGMSAPTSPLWTVQHLAHAGRGVVARQLISEGTVVHESGPPAVHVVFKQYGKETCAQCFAWDRGRTLPVRDPERSKIFCSRVCQVQWTKEHGAVGVHAWQALTTFARAQGKRAGSTADADVDADVDDELMAEAARPPRNAIDRAWRAAADEAELLLRASTSNTMSRQERRSLHAMRRKLTAATDPDLLSYFLCGTLFDYTATREQRQQLLHLAMDDVPYKTQHDLDSSCRAFLQLTSVLPPQLLPHLTPALCLNLVRADNHNAFGIRAGGEDAEEYMGYGVYPSASYFNHSCDANIHKKRMGRSWEFRAARNIVAGEECCITYLGGDEKDLDVAARRERLGDAWGFVCQCVRCQREAMSSIRSS